MPGTAQRNGSAASASALRLDAQWRWLAAIAAGVLIGVFAGPKVYSHAQSMAPDEALVLATDKVLGEAFRTGDKGTARRLLALQFIFIDGNGRIHSRKEAVGDLKAFFAVPASDAKVRSYGLIAVVTGHRRAADGADLVSLDVWVRQKGAWRALVIQNVAGVSASAPASPGAAASLARAQTNECKNPCRAIPYRVRSAAEQDVVTAFQTIMKATVAHDAGEWAKHVAEEFVDYRCGQVPTSKSDRIAAIERRETSGVPVAVGEVQTMQLSVYSDGAVMETTEAAPEDPHLLYRALRLWARRNDQWLMTVSAHTDVK